VHGPALRDRATMANDGVVTVAVGINWDQKKIVSGPKVGTRGFTVINTDPDMEKGIDDAVAEALEKQLSGGDTQGLHRVIRESASRYIHQRTRRRPVVMPLILDY